MTILTLLTDFGAQDTFVGVMKGVIKQIAPDVELIDLTHQISPQDVRAGAFALKTAYRYFPAGTVHLAVVDPGVGGARRPVAAHLGDSVYVCPDNGLLTYVLDREIKRQAVTLDNPSYHRADVSRTFHGRDIFAPAAAHLAAGVPLSALGTPVETLETFPIPRPRASGDSLLCHVLAVDGYGNVFTDLTEDSPEAGQFSSAIIDIDGQTVPGPVDSYSAVPVGAPLALFGSSGHLEIAVRNGSARDRFDLRAGDAIALRRKTGGAR